MNETQMENTGKGKQIVREIDAHLAQLESDTRFRRGASDFVAKAFKEGEGESAAIILGGLLDLARYAATCGWVSDASDLLVKVFGSKDSPTSTYGQMDKVGEIVHKTIEENS